MTMANETRIELAFKDVNHKTTILADQEWLRKQNWKRADGNDSKCLYCEMDGSRWEFHYNPKAQRKYTVRHFWKDLDNKSKAVVVTGVTDCIPMDMGKPMHWHMWQGKVEYITGHRLEA